MIYLATLASPTHTTTSIINIPMQNSQSECLYKLRLLHVADNTSEHLFEKVEAIETPSKTPNFFIIYTYTLF